MEHVHTAAMVLLFLVIGLVALKVQLEIQDSEKKDQKLKNNAIKKH
ncbi:MAG: hypothetical protein QM479_17290 [Pseudomonadota bacterium]